MATLLEHGKTVKRETLTRYQNRPLMTEQHSTFLRVWTKRRKDHVDVDYRVIYELGLKLQWKEAQREKAAKKKKGR